MATDIKTQPPPPPPPPNPVPEPPSIATPIPPRPSEPEDVINIPSYSRWFKWKSVHECEARFVPEFFDGRKNPSRYKYYRNSIVRRFRENPNRKLTFTEARKSIVGDVGSIRRVFDFLETWGLINYAGGAGTKHVPMQQVKLDDKDSKNVTSGGGGDVPVSGDVSNNKKRVCNGCKTPCTIACFASEKHDMTLCARCYVRGNYRVGLSSSDFKRVEISEDPKSDWSDKETLQLLEAMMHYGDDWKKVTDHVGGKSVKECVARFVKLPFGEQFDGPPESAELDSELGLQNLEAPAKKMRLSPLADASNPIMAQAAFLSTLAGVDVAEVAARAAVSALSNLGAGEKQVPVDASNGNNPSTMEEALAEAKSQIDKEDEELEEALRSIVTQTKEIEEKIVGFEEFNIQMEKKRQQFQQLQDRLYIDQLTLLFSKSADNITGEAVKAE